MAQPPGGKVVWESGDHTLFQYVETETKWIEVKLADGRTERIEVGSQKTVTVKDERNKKGGLVLLAGAGTANLAYCGWTCPDLCTLQVRISGSAFPDTFPDGTPYPDTFSVFTVGLDGQFCCSYDSVLHEGAFAETLSGADFDDPVYIDPETGVSAYLGNFHFTVDIVQSPEDTVEFDPENGLVHIKSNTMFYSENFHWEDGSPFIERVEVLVQIGTGAAPCERTPWWCCEATGVPPGQPNSWGHVKRVFR